jgi:hypothetical protein
MFWQTDLKMPEEVGSTLIVMVSEGEASQLVIERDTMELMERERSEVAVSALVGRVNRRDRRLRL